MAVHRSPIYTLNPASAGFGLRAPHVSQVIDALPETDFLEIHSENYFADGGNTLQDLEQVAAHYPLSFHGVALSLGSVDRPHEAHLEKLKKLVDRFNPVLVSEHIAWNTLDGTYMNDLLPVPYTQEAVDILSRNVDIVQQVLGRQILIENPSAYLAYQLPEMMDEGDFIKAVMAKSGCGLLLDVNNIYVSAMNLGLNPIAQLEMMPMPSEIHLAGHMNHENGLKIDSHGDVVCDAVWDLYQHALSQFGPIPTLIEWDLDIPALDVLTQERDKAKTMLTAREIAA